MIIEVSEVYSSVSSEEDDVNFEGDHDMFIS